MWIILGIVVFLVILWLAAGLVFYRMSLSRHVADTYRKERFDLPKTEDERELRKWEAALKPRPESVSISPDGKLVLKGLEYRQPLPDERWIIVAHGHGHSKEYMRYAAYYFYEMGMNTLLIDLRGHGDSDGRVISMGWEDKADVALWAHHLETRYSHSKIALFGLSLGAATFTMASGEDLPRSIKAIVADSAFQDVKSLSTYMCRHMFHLPPWLIWPSYCLAARVLAGLKLEEISALTQLEKGGNLPLLFIHSTTDTFIPAEMSKALYEAAGERARLHLVDGADHGCSCLVDPDYWKLVGDFINDAFEEMDDEHV